MDYNHTYNSILALMHECSNLLNSKYGYVLPGSPFVQDNIRAHYNAEPKRDYVKYGLVLVTLFDELQKCIDADESNTFIEDARKV